jgi:acetyl-CoA C-acetyltransferase
MLRDVAIVGVGCTGFKSVSPDLSYKELMFEAATRAYEDAEVDPRRDIDGFITCAEDYWEGFSIFDEFVPDQLGAVLRHLHTVTADGLYGLAHAYMLIRTGVFDTVAVEAHSKASDILTFADIVAFAMDPIFNRPLGGHPYYIGGLEMNRYLHETGATKEQCAHVVVKNKKNALANPHAEYGSDLTVDDVLDSEILFYPLSRLDISPLSDGCVVMVLASESVAGKLTDLPIWIRGVGWNSDTPWLETRDWRRAIHIELAARMAYRIAGMKDPRKEVDLAEIDDLFSYKELQSLEALRLCGENEAGGLVENGFTDRDGDLPINTSGGLLGVGYSLEASGLQKALEVVLQLRGDAGKRQVSDANTGLVQVWRGVPTASGAVAILSNV